MRQLETRLAKLEQQANEGSVPQFGWEYEPGQVEFDTGARMPLDEFSRRYPTTKLYLGFDPNEV